MEPLSGESGNWRPRWTRRRSPSASMEPLSGESGNTSESFEEEYGTKRFNGAALRRERKPPGRLVGGLLLHHASMEQLSGESGNIPDPNARAEAKEASMEPLSGESGNFYILFVL